VYDPSHRPVEKLNVELLNDVDSVVQRTKTDSAGRFTLSNIAPGRYIIKVLPYGTNLEEQTQEVIVGYLANDTTYVEFNLRYDRRSREAAIGKPAGVSFVQDIPAAAKTSYLAGIADLAKHQDKGLEELQAAIDLFPTYYDALDSLGREFVSRRMFEKGHPYLAKAMEVNPRSSSSSYSLAYAFYQLKRYPAALEAAKVTATLVPASVDAQLLYGTLLRITGSYPEAEKTLLQANTLAKKMNSETHWQLSLLYNRLNRTQDTIDELETFLKLVPDTPDKDKIRDLIGKLKTSAKPNK